MIFSSSAKSVRGGPGEVQWPDSSRAGALECGRDRKRKKKHEGICNKGMVMMSNGGQEGLMRRERVKGPEDWRCRGISASEQGRHKQQVSGCEMCNFNIHQKLW